jgi:hypothetical protein
MAEAGRAGGIQPPAGPSREELEERWKEAVDVLTERPRDPDLFVKAGQLSEQLDRKAEAYTYFNKALTLDPSKSFLVAKLRGLAVTPQQKEEVAKMAARPPSFEAALPDIFKYPVRGKGLPILIMGALLMWIGRILASRGIGTSGWTIAAFVSAYMAMFYIDVCHTTVGGDDHLPEWPDPLRIHEFGLDVGKFVCAMICSFLPVILILIFVGTSVLSGDEDEARFAKHLPPAPGVKAPMAAASDSDVDPAPASPAAPAPATPDPPEISKTAAKLMLGVIGIAVFLLVGLVYLPMATLANVVMGSPFTCFNFPFVFRSIGAAPRSYLICLACYFGVWILVGAVEFLVNVTGVLMMTGFGMALLELYGMTMLMRLLGLFYRMNQAKLAWLAD